MLTIKEVLQNKITLDIECVDRVLLNGYVKYLQMPGGLVNFIREQKEMPIPSPRVLYEMTQSYRTAVEAFARAEGLEIYQFKKKEVKEQVAKARLAKFEGESGVVLIGKAQEKTSAFKGKRADKADGKIWFNYSRQEVYVTHYYFYILDEEFGLGFIKVCTYLPFEVKVCFNGHEWAKQQFENIIRDNLDLGRPDRVSLLFERRVTKATPSEFHLLYQTLRAIVQTRFVRLTA